MNWNDTFKRKYRELFHWEFIKLQRIFGIWTGTDMSNGDRIVVLLKECITMQFNGSCSHTISTFSPCQLMNMIVTYTAYTLFHFWQHINFVICKLLEISAQYKFIQLCDLDSIIFSLQWPGAKNSFWVKLIEIHCYVLLVVHNVVIKVLYFNTASFTLQWLWWSTADTDVQCFS